MPDHFFISDVMIKTEDGRNKVIKSTEKKRRRRKREERNNVDGGDSIWISKGLEF